MPGDFCGFGPRLSGENLDHNLSLLEALRAIAEVKGATVAQIAIAWVLSRRLCEVEGLRRRQLSLARLMRERPPVTRLALMCALFRAVRLGRLWCRTARWHAGSCDEVSRPCSLA